MIVAHERSKVYGPLLQKVQASVFFGVPHRGSDTAYWATFAATLLKYGQLGLGTNATYVTALQRRSQTFADISQQFIERAANLNIRTFYETEKMLNQLVRKCDSRIDHSWQFFHSALLLALPVTRHYLNGSLHRYQSLLDVQATGLEDDF
jgi:hypothetical protein